MDTKKNYLITTIPSSGNSPYQIRLISGFWFKMKILKEVAKITQHYS